MADKLKDEQDRKLESLFRSEPLPDDGFSARVMSQLKRRLWVRRLSLPIALTIGIGISARPIMQLASALPDLLTSMSDFGSEKLEIAILPQFSIVTMGVILLATVLIAGRMLED